MGKSLNFRLMGMVFDEVMKYNLDDYVTSNYKNYIIDKLCTLKDYSVNLYNEYKDSSDKDGKEKWETLIVKDAKDILILVMTYCDGKVTNLEFCETYFVDTEDYRFLKFKKLVLEKFKTSIELDELEDNCIGCDVHYTTLDCEGEVWHKYYRGYTHPTAVEFKAKAMEDWLKQFYFDFTVLYGTDYDKLDNFKEDEINFLIVRDQTYKVKCDYF